MDDGCNGGLCAPTKREDTGSIILGGSPRRPDESPTTRMGEQQSLVFRAARHDNGWRTVVAEPTAQPRPASFGSGTSIYPITFARIAVSRGAAARTS